MQFYDEFLVIDDECEEIAIFAAVTEKHWNSWR